MVDLKKIKSSKKRKFLEILLKGPTLSEKKIKEWERDLKIMRGKCE